MKKNNRYQRRAKFSMTVTCLVTGGMLMPSSAVLAEIGGVTPYVFVSAMHDDNLFRLSDDADTTATLGSDERSDTYRTVEAGVDVSAQVSRQRFSAHGSVNETRFSRYTFLDYEGGRGQLRWDWVVGSDLQGRVGYDYSRSLASLDTQDVERNIRAEQLAYAEGDYRFSSKWRVRAGAGDRDLDNSAVTKQALDTRAVSTDVGLHYLVPADNAGSELNFIGVRLRVTDGDYPNPETIAGTIVDNSYDETETGVVAGWRFPGMSHAQAFVGYTDRRHEQFPERDYQGVTGRMTFGWQVSAKTIVNLSAWRELTVADDISPAYVLAEGAQLGPDWSITPKTTLKARVAWETRTYRGDPSLVVAPTDTRVDELESLRLAVEYAPVSAARIGLSWKTGTRDSNRPLTDYKYNSIAATLSAHF